MAIALPFPPPKDTIVSLLLGGPNTEDKSIVTSIEWSLDSYEGFQFDHMSIERALLTKPQSE